MSGPRYHIITYKENVDDAKLMLEKLKENQRNFINKTGKHRINIKALERGDLDEEFGGNDETLGRIYKYLKKEYEEPVEKKKAISYIRDTLGKMGEFVPNNLEARPLKDILDLRDKVRSDYEYWKIIQDQKNARKEEANRGTAGEGKQKKSKRRRGSKKGKSNRKNNRKRSKKGNKKV